MGRQEKEGLHFFARLLQVIKLLCWYWSTGALHTDVHTSLNLDYGKQKLLFDFWCKTGFVLEQLFIELLCMAQCCFVCTHLHTTTESCFKCAEFGKLTLIYLSLWILFPWERLDIQFLPSSSLKSDEHNLHMMYICVSEESFIVFSF